MAMLIEKTEFLVKGDIVRGCFHRPASHCQTSGQSSEDKTPLVIMFNGFATEWQFGTTAFIKACTDKGLATFNFDYRHFGESEGKPRHLLDIPEQLNDCRAAMAFVARQSWVDQDKMVIWGSSLGGGHAITMAAEHPHIAALVAQVPHCCSRAAFKCVSMVSVFKGVSAAIVDSFGAMIGCKPVMLPVVSEPEEYGVMNHPGWKAEYSRLAVNSSTWINAIVARGLLRGGDYRPITVADKITCPALLVAGTQDAGVPVGAVKETAAKIKNAELFTYEGDHFEVYQGEKQPEILEKELEFIVGIIKNV